MEKGLSQYLWLWEMDWGQYLEEELSPNTISLFLKLILWHLSYLPKTGSSGTLHVSEYMGLNNTFRDNFI